MIRLRPQTNSQGVIVVCQQQGLLRVQTVQLNKLLPGAATVQLLIAGDTKKTVNWREEPVTEEALESRDLHLNLMRLVQMRAGQKKDTTSLEMAVSVVIDPHQIFVSRACRAWTVAAEVFTFCTSGKNMVAYFAVHDTDHLLTCRGTWNYLSTMDYNPVYSIFDNTTAWV